MMNDSKVKEQWILDNQRLNPPCVRANGIIFSGPVRLSFTNLFQPQKPRTADGANSEAKYGCTLLFPPKTDFAVFKKAALDIARTNFPKKFDAEGKPVGIHWPWHDQAEKAVGDKPLTGYTPGCLYFAATSKFKPQVVDANQNPIVDESRVYPGVWAFVGMNVYSYGPPQPKTGVSFGLQTVMIIGDDQKLAGGGGDPKADFGHVQLVASTDAAKMFDEAPAMDDMASLM